MGISFKIHSSLSKLKFKVVPILTAQLSCPKRWFLPRSRHFWWICQTCLVTHYIVLACTTPPGVLLYLLKIKSVWNHSLIKKLQVSFFMLVMTDISKPTRVNMPIFGHTPIIRSLSHWLIVCLLMLTFTKFQWRFIQKLYRWYTLNHIIAGPNIFLCPRTG